MILHKIHRATALQVDQTDTEKYIYCALNLDLYRLDPESCFPFIKKHSFNSEKTDICIYFVIYNNENQNNSPVQMQKHYYETKKLTWDENTDKKTQQFPQKCCINESHSSKGTCCSSVVKTETSFTTSSCSQDFSSNCKIIFFSIGNIATAKQLKIQMCHLHSETFNCKVLITNSVVLHICQWVDFSFQIHWHLMLSQKSECDEVDSKVKHREQLQKPDALLTLDANGNFEGVFRRNERRHFRTSKNDWVF